MRKLWVRVGQGGALERFDDLSAVAAYLNSLKVGRPTRWLLHGLETQNYWGGDHISVYWGDEHGGYLAPISTAHRLYLEQSLEDAEL